MLHWLFFAFLSPHTLGNERLQELATRFLSTSLNLSSASLLWKVELEFSVYVVDPKDEDASAEPPKQLGCLSLGKWLLVIHYEITLLKEVIRLTSG